MRRPPALFRKLATVGAAAALAAVTMAAPAGAEATVTSWSGTCSTFAATGTVTADYYVVWVQSFDENTGWTEYWEVHPSGDGTFDFEFVFEAFPEGTTVEYLVWGSPTPDDNWDEEDYFEAELECELAPDPPVPPTPPTPPVDPGDDTAPADVVRTTPRFTG